VVDAPVSVTVDAADDPGRSDYYMTAQRLAEALVTEVADIHGAECVLASRIGRPITEPEPVDVKLRLAPGRAPEAFTRVVEEMTRRELSETADSWREAVDDDLAGRD